MGRLISRVADKLFPCCHLPEYIKCSPAGDAVSTKRLISQAESAPLLTRSSKAWTLQWLTGFVLFFSGASLAEGRLLGVHSCVWSRPLP